MQFQVDPSQAIKVAKYLGKDITESYSKIKNKERKKLTPIERTNQRATLRQYLFKLQKTASEILPTERVAYCHNCRADFKKTYLSKLTKRHRVVQKPNSVMSLYVMTFGVVPSVPRKYILNVAKKYKSY